MATADPKIVANPKLLNLHSVAAELGCSVDTVDRFIRAGKLPVVRLPSGRRRIDRTDLDRTIADWKTEGR